MLYLPLPFPVLIIGNSTGIAITILCFAFNAFADRKIVRFSLLVLLAFLSHRSFTGAAAMLCS